MNAEYLLVIGGMVYTFFTIFYYAYSECQYPENNFTSKCIGYLGFMLMVFGAWTVAYWLSYVFAFLLITIINIGIFRVRRECKKEVDKC